MSFNESALRRADGNQQKADYLLDCSYFEWYYRIAMYNNFVNWKNEEIKKQTQK